MKILLENGVGSRGSNQFPLPAIARAKDSPEGGSSIPSLVPCKTIQELTQIRRKKALSVLRKLLWRNFSGRELGFFFIPKRNSFKKMSEKLAFYSSQMAMRFEPKRSEDGGHKGDVGGATKTDDDSDEESFDFSGRLEFMFSRAQAKIARKLMLGLRGSVRVVSLSRETIFSSQIDYGSFCDLMRGLERSCAFYPERMVKYRLKISKLNKLRPKKSAKAPEARPDPIFFKMKAKVPEVLLNYAEAGSIDAD